MTTKSLTIKFAKFPNFIVMEILRKKNSVFGQFSVNFPLPDPLQNANFIDIVVSASLRILGGANLPQSVSREMGYRSDSIAISRDMGLLRFWGHPENIHSKESEVTAQQQVQAPEGVDYRLSEFIAEIIRK